jgi:riboflavin-specific deaminase-like protein
MLWPSTHDDVDPIAVYAADRRSATARPWVMVNMITTVDGSAAGASGVSGDLGGPADKKVFSAIRAVADVIVAGSATITTEDYGPSRPSPSVTQQRLARGQAARPRLAVVTGSLRVNPEQRLFRDATPDARPIVLTTERADPRRRRALEAVSEVRTAGVEQVDWPRAIDVLHSTAGARVVLCEGGPRTNSQLVAHDLVDELCVTVAPMLLSGTGSRIIHGPGLPAPLGLTLDRVLTEDGYLFLRYVRDRATG